MIRFLLILFLIHFSLITRAQDKVTLNGYVKDADNGEELIGVTVYIPKLQAGTVTNPYGFYSITVPAGTYDVQFSFVGFKTQTVSLALTENQTRNIELANEATVIQEVVVTDKPLDANVVDVQMSRHTIDIAQTRKLPALFGEVDIIKNVQMLPRRRHGRRGYFQFLCSWRKRRSESYSN